MTKKEHTTITELFHYYMTKKEHTTITELFQVLDLLESLDMQFWLDGDLYRG